MSRARPRIPVGTLAGSNVTTSYVQLSAALGQDVNHVEIDDTSACAGPISVAFGPAGFEVEAFQFAPGTARPIGVLLNKGMRISYKSLSGSSATGTTLLRLFQ